MASHQRQKETAVNKMTSFADLLYYSSPFLQGISSYSSFHLLSSRAWPPKRSQAQRLSSPYGPRIEGLVLWKKVFNCSWHFRGRQALEATIWQAVTMVCEAGNTQPTPGPWGQVGQVSYWLSHTSSHPEPTASPATSEESLYDSSCKTDRSPSESNTLANYYKQTNTFRLSQKHFRNVSLLWTSVV